MIQTNSKQPYASPVFPLTAGDINIYHARSIADQQITYVLEFDGKLDLDKLNAAFGILVRELPILSCILNVDGSHFCRVPVAGYNPQVILVDQPESVSQVIERFVGTPCNPESEPPLKLLLIRDKVGRRRSNLR